MPVDQPHTNTNTVTVDQPHTSTNTMPLKSTQAQVLVPLRTSAPAAKRKVVVSNLLGASRLVVLAVLAVTAVQGFWLCWAGFCLKSLHCVVWATAQPRQGLPCWLSICRATLIHTRRVCICVCVCVCVRVCATCVDVRTCAMEMQQHTDSTDEQRSAKKGRNHGGECTVRTKGTLAISGLRPAYTWKVCPPIVVPLLLPLPLPLPLRCASGMCLWDVHVLSHFTLTTTVFVLAKFTRRRESFHTVYTCSTTATNIRAPLLHCSPCRNLSRPLVTPVLLPVQKSMARVRAWRRAPCAYTWCIACVNATCLHHSRLR